MSDLVKTDTSAPSQTGIDLSFGARTRASKIIREIIAALFWIYSVTKIFIFDVDRHLTTTYFPSFHWLLDLKFFVLIGGTALSFFLFGVSRTLLWFVYIAFYPFVLLFWQIPRLVLKQKSWTILLAIINSLVSFFHSLRYNVILFAVWMIAVASAFVFDNKTVVVAATSTLIAAITLIFFRRFASIFRDSAFLKIHSEALVAWRDHLIKTNRLDDSLRTLPVSQLNETQLQKWSGNLEALLMFNRACLVYAKKLRSYQQSGISILSGIAVTIFLTALTSFSFAVVNLALFKIDSASFDRTIEPTFFTFFYFSFNNMLFSSIKELSPATMAAQSVAMLENFLALLILAIFLSLAISVRSDRRTRALNKIIGDLEREGQSMEQMIIEDYRIASIDDALRELERLQTSLAKILVWLTKQLR